MTLNVMLLLTVLTAKSACMAFGSGAEKTGHDSWIQIQKYLPLDTAPSFYSIFLHPNIDDGTYTGRAKINVHTTAKKHYLWLHAYTVNISNTVVLALPSKTEVPVKSTFMYYTNHFFVIEFVDDISAGDYLLQIEYYGKIDNTELLGEFFYSYNDSDKVESRIMYSASCFPCFDEEQFKVTFQMQVVQPGQGYKVISNTMPQNTTKDFPIKGLSTVTFEKTPVMRVDSIFFLVQRLNSLPTAHTQGGITVTMYGTTNVLKYLQRSLEAAVKCLDFYTSYFGVSLPIKKIDVISLPPTPVLDMNFGFEVLGSVLAGEDILAYHEPMLSGTDDINKIMITSQLLATAWFVELATPKWGTEFILSTSVTEYIKLKAAKHVYPTWNTDLYKRLDYYYSMHNEADPTRAPLAVTVPSDDTEKVSVDSMTSKGPAILEMLECIMGEENTRKGYTDYLKKYQYSTTVVPDLWNAMKTYAPAGVDVPTLMSTWTLQNTLPIVNVARSRKTLTLTQSRLVDDGNFTNDQPPSPYNYKWVIHLNITGSDNFCTQERLVLGLENPKLVVQLPTEVTWIKVNPNQCGFYRTQYSSEDWTRLANLLVADVNALGAVDRAGILDDVFTFAELEYGTYETALNMTTYMCKETEFLPFYVLLEVHIDNIASLVKTSFGYVFFREYLRRLLAPLINLETWNFSPLKTPDLRWFQSLLIKHACLIKIESCVITARQMFVDWLHTDIKPPSDVRSIVYNTGIQLSGISEWKIVWEAFSKESDSEEKEMLRKALCQNRNPWIIKQIFDLAQEEDLISFLTYCVDNPVGIPLVWNYIRENVEFLAANFTSSFPGLLETVTNTFSTTRQLIMVKSFFQDMPETVAADVRKTTILKGIEKRITQIQKHAGSVSSWFASALSDLRC